MCVVANTERIYMQFIFLKVDWIILTALSLLSFVAFISTSNIFSIVCLTILFLLSLIKFRYALFFYASMLPVWNLVGGVMVALGASYILIGVFLARLIASKESLLAKPYLSFIFIVLFFVLLGTLTSGYYEYLNTTLIFISVSFVSYIFANQVIKNEKNLHYIGMGLIAAALIAFIVSFVASGGEFRRLTLGGLKGYEGGSVRQLANILGVSLVLLPLFFKRLNDSRYSSVVVRPLFYALTMFLLIGLVLTSSRGVILAVVLSIIVYFFSANKVSIKNSFFILISLISAYFVFNILISWLEVSNSLSLTEERFNNEAIEGGLGSRLRIWGAGLSNMSAANYLFGHGLASFRFLALQSGVDYYSHSVFVAILTDTGLIPFSLLLILLARIALNIKCNKTFIALPILIYAVVSHASHGGTNSTYFWLLLAIAYAVSGSKNLQQNQ